MAQPQINDFIPHIDPDIDNIPFVDVAGRIVPVIDRWAGYGEVNMDGRPRLSGLMDDQLEADQRTITSIAKRECSFDSTAREDELMGTFGRAGEEVQHEILMIGDISLPWKPTRELNWRWNHFWAFYSERYRTMRDLCNRKFDMDKRTTPLTLWLTHLYWSAVYKGRCHLLGIRLTTDRRHPARVSFGKRKHSVRMSSGWDSDRPTRLDQFSLERCDVVAEAWMGNLLRGNRSREDIEQYFSVICVRMVPDGRGSELAGSFRVLRMEDGEVEVSHLSEESESSSGEDGDDESVVESGDDDDMAGRHGSRDIDEENAVGYDLHGDDDEEQDLRGDGSARAEIEMQQDVSMLSQAGGSRPASPAVRSDNSETFELESILSLWALVEYCRRHPEPQPRATPRRDAAKAALARTSYSLGIDEPEQGNELVLPPLSQEVLDQIYVLASNYDEDILDRELVNCNSEDVLIIRWWIRLWRTSPEDDHSFFIFMGLVKSILTPFFILEPPDRIS